MERLHKRPKMKNIIDEQQIFKGTDPVQLAYPYVIPESERIKTIDSLSPYFDGANQLIGTSWKVLDHANIVPGTLVMASDTLLSIIYMEGIDFVVDYLCGKIKRVPEGSIPDATSIYIWYQYYTVHIREKDYTIDEESGTLIRVPSGDIANGSVIMVDYKTSILQEVENDAD